MWFLFLAVIITTIGNGNAQESVGNSHITIGDLNWWFSNLNYIFLSKCKQCMCFKHSWLSKWAPHNTHALQHYIAVRICYHEYAWAWNKWMIKILFSCKLTCNYVFYFGKMYVARFGVASFGPQPPSVAQKSSAHSNVLRAADELA